MDSRTLNFFLFFSLLSTAFSTEISVQGDTSVAFNEDASFSCTLSDPEGVSQVTWQILRKGKLVDGNLATYSTRYGENVMKPNIVFSKASLNSTSITVKNVSVVDEGCYVCTFHVYPSGSVRKQTCLTVHGISSSRIFTYNDEKTLVVGCTATGKPAPEVTWSTAYAAGQGDRQTVVNQDGTTTVSVNLTLSTVTFQDKSVDCVVKTPGLPGNVTESFVLPEKPKDKGSPPEVFSGVLAIVVVAVLVASITLYCHFVRRDKGYGRNFLERLQRNCCYSAVPSEEENPVEERCLPWVSCPRSISV